jgi:hypothetical protein
VTEDTATEIIKYENRLNEALRDVVLDIRSVALVDLASFIHSDRLENIGDIFETAIELHFKLGTLHFSYAADLEVRWVGIPIVSLYIEFHCMDIDIYFKLEIDSYASRTKIVHATVGNRLIEYGNDFAVFDKALQFSQLNRAQFIRSFDHSI